MKKLLVSWTVGGILCASNAQETFQVTVVLAATNDPTAVFASGTLQLTGNARLVLNNYAAWGAIAPKDTDRDGIPDYLDACPNTAPGAVINAEGCSIEQIAPCASPWRNHGEYVNRVKAVTEEFARAGLITEDQRRGLSIQAAHSGCGRQ